MKCRLISAIAAASIALSAVPAMAQTPNQAEEARTTYRITYLKLKVGADERWTELREKYFGPAAVAAGQKRATVHWMMGGPWQLMLIMEMPRGMATLDAHETPERKAYREALAKIAGGADAAKKLNDENSALVADSLVTYSHTHP